MSGCARRGASGALFPKSALCGAESPLEDWKLKSQEAILTGRRATDGHEPRQIRKEAAIRDAVCVVDRFRSYMWSADFGKRFNRGCTTNPPKTCLYRRCPHLFNAFLWVIERLKDCPQNSISAALTMDWWVLLFEES